MISIHFAHVSDCIHLVNINVIDLLNILLYFWLGKTLVDFEYQNIVIYFFPRSLQQDLMVDEAIVRLFFGEITVLRSLSRT